MFHKIFLIIFVLSFSNIYSQTIEQNNDYQFFIDLILIDLFDMLSGTHSFEYLKPSRQETSYNKMMRVLGMPLARARCRISLFLRFMWMGLISISKSQKSTNQNQFLTKKDTQTFHMYSRTGICYNVCVLKVSLKHPSLCYKQSLGGKAQIFERVHFTQHIDKVY